MKRMILIALALVLAPVTLLSVIATASATDKLEPLGLSLREKPSVADPSQAQQPTVSIHMSAAPDGAVQTHFPSGTGTVYATMTYSEATQTQIQVKMYDDTGIPILWETVGQESHPYVEYTKTGSGSELITVSGDRVFLAYFQEALWQGDSMQENITKALDSLDQGRSIAEIRGHIEAARTAGNGFRKPLTRLRDDYVTSADVSDPVNQAYNDLAQALNEAAAALDPNLSDRDQIRSHVQQMQTFTNQAVAQTMQAQTAAGTGASYTLLDTTPCQQNVTQLVVDGRLSRHVEWTVREKGAPAQIEISAQPSRIYAGSVTVPSAVHSTSVQAIVSDVACIPVDPILVQFATVPADPARGTLTPTEATTVDGVAMTTLTAGPNVGDGALGITAIAGGASGTYTVTVIGPPANVTFRNINRYVGTGSNTRTPVQVDVRDINAREVADGTEVTFSLDPPTMGQWEQQSATTIDGSASTILISGDTRGPAAIVATADGVASDPFPITFVGPPASVKVTPDPVFAPIIGESASSDIVVEVWDAYGEKAPDGTEVIFSVDPPGIADFSPSSEAILRDGSTSRTLNLLPPGFPDAVTVTVTAGSASGQARVVFYEGTLHKVFVPSVLKGFSTR